MMKQVLLRVTAVLAKMRLRKFAQLPGRDFLSARQITLSQNPLDPDVDWKCAEPLVCKEHHAICDLRSYARQSAQCISQPNVRKCRPCIKITLPGTYELRSRAQVFGAITELAFA